VLVGVVFCLGVGAFARDGQLPVGLVVGAVALAAIGFLDDVRSLPVRVRLAGQLAAASSLVVGTSTAGPLSAWLTLVSVVFIAGFTNAFNFMDGINGISGVAACISGIWYAAWGATAGNSLLVVVGVGIAASAAGFLLWNVGGRIFLGDVGSYVLGGLLAFCCLLGWRAGDMSWWVAGAPLVIYVVDTTWTMGRRALTGHQIGVAHRDHVYQQLTARGESHLKTSLMVGAFITFCCGAAWLGRSAEVATLAAWTVAAATYVALPRLLDRAVGERA